MKAFSPGPDCRDRDKRRIRERERDFQGCFSIVTGHPFLSDITGEPYSYLRQQDDHTINVG